MNAVYRALARCNVEDIRDFNECFADRLLDDSAAIFTFFISPNQYEDFVQTVRAYQNRSMDYIWYYPVWETTEPVVPEGLDDKIRFIHVRK